MVPTLVAAFALAGGTAAVPIHHHQRRVQAAQEGPLESHEATYYSVPPCDEQGTQTATGATVHFGVIASSYIPLHTHLRLTKPLHGLRDFYVLDTGAPFDVWLPCGSWTRGWNNPTLSFRRVR